MRKCPKCGSDVRIQVQAVISAPGELAHQFSKKNLRRKDVHLMGVLWETMDTICTNEKCQHITDGYGNYVTNLKKENERLKIERDKWEGAARDKHLEAIDWAGRHQILSEELERLKIKLSNHDE